MTIQELAKIYAYEMLTCPGSTEDVDTVLDSWKRDKHCGDATIWEPFEEYEPDELLDQFEEFETAFRNCIKEFLENS